MSDVRLLDVVIPVYNEHESIASTLDALKNNVQSPYRVLIVYDHPEDTTLPAVDAYRTSHPEMDIVCSANRFGSGALNAIKSGMASAEATAVLVVMADMSDDLRIVDRMLEMIGSGYDLVCGSRYMRGGQQIGGPVFKKFLSRLAGLTLYYIAGVPTHDATNSFKLYRKSMLDRIQCTSTGGFEIGMEIVVKAHIGGYKIGELPSVWHDRTAGSSRFRLWQWIPHYLRWYFLAFGNRLGWKRHIGQQS